MGMIQVPDVAGQPNFAYVQQPGTPTDRSGTITTTGATQTLLGAVPTGTVRSGWIVQNNGVSSMNMLINDLGSPAAPGPTAIVLAPGQFWPPPGYPVTQGEVDIAGQAGDNFMAREW